LAPIPEIVSTGIFFPLIFMCTLYLHCIHPLTPFPYLFPTPTGINPSRQDLFCFSVLWFCKRKKEEMTVLLV
jgi:hypothetical protein